MQRMLLLCVLLFYCPSLFSFPLGVYQSCREKGDFVLSFDDGVTENYPDLLDLLDSLHVKATFFVEGEKLVNPRHLLLLKEVVKRGHEIGNHSFTHPFLTKQTDDEFTREILDTQNGINLSGYRGVKYMRTPFGDIDQRTYDILFSLGFFKVVMWEMDTKDWIKKRSKEKLWTAYENFLFKADPLKRSFISLQHSRRQDSVDLLPDLILLVRLSGFKIVTMSECLGVKDDLRDTMSR